MPLFRGCVLCNQDVPDIERKHDKKNSIWEPGASFTKLDGILMQVLEIFPSEKYTIL
jgi:hypothetical protein